MVSRIGPIATLLLLVDGFEPICDAIKSTITQAIAATGGIEIKLYS